MNPLPYNSALSVCGQGLLVTFRPVVPTIKPARIQTHSGPIMSQKPLYLELSMPNGSSRNEALA
jgi:hypothetical protein